MPATRPKERPPGRTETRASYPLDRLNERVLEASYRGPVFLWDIDKTYLDTRFSKLKDVLSTALEFAIDKNALPGTVELLRGIRRGRSGRDLHPLYFISASPRQMLSVLAKKMTMDGVEYDGITLKDPVALTRQMRFGELRNQVAYKLCALLEQRRLGPAGAREYLFGDDAENDADIYELYARIASGEVRGGRLEEELRRLGTPPKGIPDVIVAAKGLARNDTVQRIYIHLVRGTPTSRYEKFGDGLLACPTPLSMAVDLFFAGLIGLGIISEVVNGIRASDGRAREQLLGEWEAYRRRFRPKAWRQVARALSEA